MQKYIVLFFANAIMDSSGIVIEEAVGQPNNATVFKVTDECDKCFSAVFFSPTLQSELAPQPSCPFQRYKNVLSRRRVA